MIKLIFKSFYPVLALFLISLLGCGQITGKTSVPYETAKNPEAYFCTETDCSKVFESKIKSANFSVHCAFYDIELKNIINALAKKIDVHPSQLSMALRGERTLPPGKEDELKKFLSKIPK